MVLSRFGKRERERERDGRTGLGLSRVKCVGLMGVQRETDANARLAGVSLERVGS